MTDVGSPKGKRLAHAYAVRELRRLGRELVAGSWSRDAEPLTVPQASVVIAKALVTTLDWGVASVRDALDDRLAELFGTRD